MKRLISSLLIVLSLLATAITASAQVSIEQIDRQVTATVRSWEDPDLVDSGEYQSFDEGPLDLLATASLIGSLTAFQSTDLLNEGLGLTFAGVYRVHAWQETPDVSEVYEASFSSILVFSLVTAGHFDLTLTPATDANGAHVFLLDLAGGSLLDTVVDAPQTFGGALVAERQYLLQVVGGYSAMMAAPFDRNVGLDIDFVVTSNGPVAVESVRWNEVKALFE